MYWRLVKLIVGAFVLLIVVNVLFPQAGDRPKAEDARTITIYAALPPEHLQKAALEFERVSGIKVLYVSLSQQDILTRIRTEKSLSQADIWLGAGLEYLLQAKKEGLLSPYTVARTEEIPANWQDPDGYWVGVYIDVPVFVTNRDLFVRQNQEPPRVWEDLLKVQQKNKIAMADPGVSYATACMFSAIQQQLGQEASFAYFTKLHQNIQHYVKEAAVPGRMVAMGEMSVGILGANDALRYMREGFPLILTFAEENMGYQLFGAGILAGAPHSQEARMFMDWLSSKEGQTCLLSDGLYYFPTNHEVQPPQELLFFKDLDIAGYNIINAAENKAKMIEKWNMDVRFGVK